MANLNDAETWISRQQFCVYAYNVLGFVFSLGSAAYLIARHTGPRPMTQVSFGCPEQDGICPPTSRGGHLEMTCQALLKEQDFTALVAQVVQRTGTDQLDWSHALNWALKACDLTLEYCPWLESPATWRLSKAADETYFNCFHETPRVALALAFAVGCFGIAMLIYARKQAKQLALDSAKKDLSSDNGDDNEQLQKFCRAHVRELHLSASGGMHCRRASQPVPSDASPESAAAATATMKRSASVPNGFRF